MLNLELLVVGIASLILVSADVHAVEKVDSDIASGNTSEFWVNYVQDENDAQNYSLGLNIGLGLDDSLLVSAGQSESELLGEAIETNSFLLGYSHFGTAPWTTNAFYEYWGKRRELVIESVGIGVNYFATDWNAGIEFEYRDIDFFTRELMAGQRRYTVNSMGIGFNTGLSSGQLTWSLNGMWYDYSENIQRLNTARGIFILGLKNFYHVSSLNEWTTATGLYYRFNSSRLGLNYSYGVAKLDGAASSTVSLLFDVELTDEVAVETELGRSFAEQDVTTDYVLVGFGFHF